VSLLFERSFPLSSLRLFASSDSEGTELEFGEEMLTVEELDDAVFSDFDIAIFAVPRAVSLKYVPRAVECGCCVIDASCSGGPCGDSLLVVPEVNGAEFKQYLAGISGGRGFAVKSPGAAAVQLAVVLKPISERAGLRRVSAVFCFAASLYGHAGMSELWGQTVEIFSQREVSPKVFSRQVAFNCFPQAGEFDDGGCTTEERRVIDEVCNLLKQPELGMAVTGAVVGVMSCHSAVLSVETERKLSTMEAAELLRNSPGIIVTDALSEEPYPTAIDMAGSDAVYVGRVRQDDSRENGLQMWVVADDLRKGSALNMVEIAEIAAEKMI